MKKISYHSFPLELKQSTVVRNSEHAVPAVWAGSPMGFQSAVYVIWALLMS